MTLSELICLIQDDLKNEYRHMLFYLHASINVQGLHREELSEFFSKQAASEMKHIQEFGQLLIGLGEVPLIPTLAVDFQYIVKPKDLLHYAVTMEEEVADNYAKRIQQAESLGGTPGLMAHVFFEDQLSDSWTDAKHMKEMLHAD